MSYSLWFCGFHFKPLCLREKCRLWLYLNLGLIFHSTWVFFQTRNSRLTVLDIFNFFVRLIPHFVAMRFVNALHRMLKSINKSINAQVKLNWGFSFWSTEWNLIHQNQSKLKRQNTTPCFEEFLKTWDFHTCNHLELNYSGKLSWLYELYFLKLRCQLLLFRFVDIARHRE